MRSNSVNPKSVSAGSAAIFLDRDLSSEFFKRVFRPSAVAGVDAALRAKLAKLNRYTRNLLHELLHSRDKLRGRFAWDEAAMTKPLVPSVLSVERGSAVNIPFDAKDCSAITMTVIALRFRNRILFGTGFAAIG